MATRGEMFSGLTVALVTPMKGTAVDYDALGKLVDWHVEQGTDCLAPVGTTGESPTLDHEEHEKVVATLVGGDETETLRRVEPLHRAYCHFTFLCSPTRRSFLRETKKATGNGAPSGVVHRGP